MGCDVSHRRLLRLQHLGAFRGIRDLEYTPATTRFGHEKVLVALTREGLRDCIDPEHLARDA